MRSISDGPIIGLHSGNVGGGLGYEWMNCIVGVLVVAIESCADVGLLHEDCV